MNIYGGLLRLCGFYYLQSQGSGNAMSNYFHRYNKLEIMMHAIVQVVQ